MVSVTYLMPPPLGADMMNITCEAGTGVLVRTKILLPTSLMINIALKWWGIFFNMNCESVNFSKGYINMTMYTRPRDVERSCVEEGGEREKYLFLSIYLYIYRGRVREERA